MGRGTSWFGFSSARLCADRGPRGTFVPRGTSRGAARVCDGHLGSACRICSLGSLPHLGGQPTTPGRRDHGGSNDFRCRIWVGHDRRSTTTRSTRRGNWRSGSSVSSAAPSDARARYSRPTLPRSTRSSGAPNADVLTLRTSTTTRLRGGPGSTATMSSSSRPIARLRTTTRHPPCSRYAAASDSADAPRRCLPVFTPRTVGAAAYLAVMRRLVRAPVRGLAACRPTRSRSAPAPHPA
jgi:hypothetical protein